LVGASEAHAAIDAGLPLFASTLDTSKAGRLNRESDVTV